MQVEEREVLGFRVQEKLHDFACTNIREWGALSSAEYSEHAHEELHHEIFFG